MIRVFLILFLLFPGYLYAQDVPPYDRNAFGRWFDKDRDCRDTRAEILIDESLVPVVMDERGCRVISGMWIDYFTFEVLTDASIIDIDHLVPVFEVWIRGAYAWTRAERVYFYNDRLNLVVTHQSVNRSKGNKKPHQLEHLIANMCGFVIRWFEVKDRYQLSFDEEELHFIREKTMECMMNPN